MKLLIIALLLVLLAACAAPVPEAPPPVFQPPVATPEALHLALATLPGAEPLEGDALGSRYDEGVLFSSGAVLPLPGGVSMLDPLVEFFGFYPDNRWVLRVRAATEYGADYDLRLAEGRAQILERYFTGRGVPAERLEWHIEAAQGAPLEVRPLP